MPKQRPYNILIAEDEKPMAKTLCAKLNASGFNAKIAENGQEALDMMAKEHFDLLILDLMMPEKDGFAVLEELETKTEKPLILVSSNLSQSDDIEHVKQFTITDYLIKSNTPLNDVVKRIEQLLAKHAS